MAAGGAVRNRSEIVTVDTPRSRRGDAPGSARPPSRQRV